MPCRWSLLFLVFALGCAGDASQIVTSEGDDIEDVDDTVPPVIEHTPVTDSQPYLTEVLITATVTDDSSGVFVVEVIYKRVDSTVWFKTSLIPEDVKAGDFIGAIPADDVQSSGMDYYLYAVDKEGNEAYDPEDGEVDAYHFRVDGDG